MIRFVLACAAAMALSGLGFGQQEGKVYILQPEDTLHVQIYRTNIQQDQIAADVIIDRYGDVTAPYAGLIHAAGKTTAQIETELTAIYIQKLRLRDPIVSVTISHYRRILASVTGQVQHPGQIEIRPGDTLLDLVSAAGGYVKDLADLRRATLRHRGSSEAIPIDLYSMLNRADATQNFPIQDGDEFNVPEQTRNRILVLGMVQRPSQYLYTEPMTLADAIALAGGEIRYRSMFSKTTIYRQRPGLPGQYYRITADFVRFMKKNDQTQNIELQPGDLVYVPEVNTPDFQQISQLVNVAYIVNQFGGSLFGFHIFH